jgi:hypothetical protein
VGTGYRGEDEDDPAHESQERALREMLHCSEIECWFSATQVVASIVPASLPVPVHTADSSPVALAQRPREPALSVLQQAEVPEPPPDGSPDLMGEPALIEVVPAPGIPQPSDSGSTPDARLTPESGTPLAGILPLDLKQLEQGVDAFFEQLAHLCERWQGADLCPTLLPWLVVAAAAAWELAFLPGGRAPADCRSSGEALADPLIPGWGPEV